jgi:hypothetical protein
MPHPTLSKGEGFKKSEVEVLSFGEDLGEAKKSRAKERAELKSSPLERIIYSIIRF